jgi:hypothetical protein
VADWRQIQARIRKAKATPEPVAQLEKLFERTHDGMVAYEIARLAEQASQTADAVRWYTAAAERFRREEWKKKAEEALQKLGAELPPVPEPPRPTPSARLDLQSRSAQPEPQPFSDSESGYLPGPEPPLASALPAQEPSGEALEPSRPAAAPAAQPAKKGRRRRRGGRRHRKLGRGTAPAAAVPAPMAEPPAIPSPELSEAEALPTPEPEPAPEPAGEPVRLAPAWATYARTGEPALASRLAKLEARLRRLLACPPHALDQAEQAPVGPGVFLLSDSDLQSLYYVEACKTLRGALSQLARGRSRAAHREGRSLRARLADHLGIGETRVSRYLKESCVVRWLQLDEDAGALAHFAVAVLTPALNEVEPE